MAPRAILSASFRLAALRRTLLGAALTAAVAVGAQPAPAPPASLRLGLPNAGLFPEVTLFAFPTDPQGRFLPGLEAAATREGFTVHEDGAPARILRVESSGGTLDVCLALDRSASMDSDDKIGYARAAAVEFVRTLGPGDRAALVTFANGSTLEQGLSHEREPLIEAIQRVEATGDTTTFIDALYWSVSQVAIQSHGSVVAAGPGRRDARRVVVALTDGLDRHSRILYTELIPYARANGVQLCLVAVGEDAFTAQMEFLAAQTGGIFLRAERPEQLQRLYGELARDLRREYRIVYRSPRPTADGTTRQVRLGLGRTGLSGDTSYVAPAQGSLIATGGGSGADSGASVGQAGGTFRPSGVLVVGLVLMGLGLVGGVTALCVWLGSRRGRRLAIHDSNPRLDLLPLAVPPGSTRVGRAADSDLVLDSQQVSRRHARIEAWDGVFRLFDEGSRNGTFVNGRRVRKSREIRVGDVLRFGDREFRFAGEAQP